MLPGVVVCRCQVTGLVEGQWYAYRVRALNRLGASIPCKATDEIQAVDPKGNNYINKVPITQNIPLKESETY